MFARVTSNQVRPIVEEKAVKWLGSVGGYDYAEHRGTEYMVTPNPVDPQAYSRQSGEVMIAKPVRETVDGTRVERDALHRALPVESGTFARLSTTSAKQTASLALRNTPRPLDRASRHPLLRARAAEMLRFRPEADPAVADLSTATRGIILPARGKKRGAEAIIGALASKGVELTLSADKAAIVPMAPRGVVDSTREILEDLAPLLRAHLAGEPLVCVLDHPRGKAPAAVTLAVGGAAMCEQHAAGELAP